MRQFWMAAAGVGMVLLGACRDTIGLEGNASAEDRAEILSVITAEGFSDEVVGFEDFAASFAVAALGDGIFPAAAEPDAEVILPERWARRLGPPVSRTRTVNVSGDSATVILTAEFEGTLRALLPKDNAEPDTLSRPFRHTAAQTALLVRAEADGRRRWQLAQLSPQQWVMTDAAQQTIQLTQVTVTVNDVVTVDVTDPAALFDVAERLPRLHREDVVSVVARLSNTANTENQPPEFVFLHLLHADPLGLGWRRIRMERQDDGSYGRTWVARHTGRSRIVVDAIDSQTFAPAGEYRANLWGIPYRIED